MSVLIVYDSIFGNTAQVAQAMADAVSGARAAPVSDAATLDLNGVTLLVIGSPTRGFRPTPAIQEFVDGLGDDMLAGRRVAVFDTRLDLETVHPAPLRWVMEVGGYAANTLERLLAERGCVMSGKPAGFLVGGTEGPLQEGELERARNWLRALADTAG
ncbi:MAG TPA: flavodoxin domain-containing protein, partial [Devosia sp.]|nr:flavodoxin domain-containing protein [Devosia sp.]